MSEWILIIFITGLTNGGGGIGSVRFKTQQGCIDAIKQFPSDKQIFASYGRKSLFGICVEDKK